MDSETKIPGNAFTISNCTFTPPSGKTFKEWNTSSDGTGTSYTEGGTYNVDENLVLYAQWKDAKIAFRSYGEPLEAVGNYTYGPIGTTVELNEGNSISIGTGTIQDNWKVFYEDSDFVYLIYGDYYPTFGVQKNNDINTITLGSYSSYKYGVSDNTNRNNLLKYLRNYSEYSWTSSQDTFGNGGNQYASWNNLRAGLLKTNVLNGKNISIQGSPDIELWDKSWMEKGNNTIFTATTKNSNGYQIYGTTSYKNLSYTTPWVANSVQADGTGYYDSLYFPYTQTNSYGYGYWLASPGANSTSSICGIYYDGSMRCDISYSSTLYCARPVIAIEKQGYTITYNINTEAGTTNTETKLQGKDYEISRNKFTAPSGQEFKEWNTLSNGTGVSYKECEIYDIDSNLTLYAQWKTEKTAFRSYGAAPEVDENYTYGPIGTTVELNDGNNISLGSGTIQDNWKVFYEDNDYVYLIYGDYYPALGVQKNHDINTILFNSYYSSGYVYKYGVTDSTNRTNILKYLRNNSNYSWTSSTDTFGAGGTEYASWKTLKSALLKTSILNGKTISIQGSPDIELWDKSWTTKENSTIINTSSKVNSNGYLIYGSTSYNNMSYNSPWSTHSVQADGTGYYDTLYFPYRASNNYAYGYWLASPGAYNANSLCGVYYDGNVRCDISYNSTYYCARPVISIEKDLKCTITYNANGGTGTTSSGEKTNGVDYTIAANGFTAPSGKVFKEWNTQADGNGTSYRVGTTYSTDADLTLYAIWKDPVIANQSYGTPVATDTIAGTYGTLGTQVQLNGGNDIAVGDGTIQDNWKVFYEDDDYVYLIYGDYYPAYQVQTNSDISSITLGTSTSYKYRVYGSSRANLLKYLRNNSAYEWNSSSPYGDNHGTGGSTYTSWNNLKTKLSSLTALSGKTISIQGSPDIDLWVKSWNAKGNTALQTGKSKLRISNRISEWVSRKQCKLK